MFNPLLMACKKTSGSELGSELVSNNDFTNGTTGFVPDNATVVDVDTYHGRTNVMRIVFDDYLDRVRFDTVITKAGDVAVELSYYIEAPNLRFDAADGNMVGSAGNNDFINDDTTGVWIDATTTVQALGATTAEQWFRTESVGTIYYIDYISMKEIL